MPMEVWNVRVAAVILLAFALMGCATQTYYACRDDGRTREFCKSYPGRPG
jgi:hypothetical protein